jgi:hypothetical protein
MTIEFVLNNGTSLKAEMANFDSKEFTTQLNNPQTLFVSIGNSGFQKHTLLYWNEVTPVA